eukprot:gene40872-50571_t
MTALQLVTFESASSTLTTIGTTAFQSSGTMSGFTFTLPASLTSIGTSAFASSGILAAAIPAAVTSLATQADQSATKLATLTFLGTSLTQLSDSAFKSTTALTSVTLPASGLTTIGVSTFSGSSLTGSLDLSTSTNLTTISTSAFANNVLLVYVWIPDSVINIGTSAFAGDTSLKCHFWTSATLGGTRYVAGTAFPAGVSDCAPTS